MDQPRARILVMAKAPVAGRAKTRLEPLLGPVGCARLQAALVAHTVATAAGLAPTAVAVAGDEALVTSLTGGVPTFAQCDGDLGARLTAAVEHARDGAAIVVVGTDCPQLAAAHVDAALRGIGAGDDVVFGPAHDGGYYLVALAAGTPAAPVFDLPPDAWGGAEVLALSRAAAARAGLRAGLIGVEHDLDTPQDAATALADPRTPPAVAALLHPPPP